MPFQTGEAFFISIADLDALDRGWRKQLGEHFKSGDKGVPWACNLTSACFDKVEAIYGALSAKRKILKKELTRKWDCCQGSCRCGSLKTTIDGKVDLDIPDDEAC